VISVNRYVNKKKMNTGEFIQYSMADNYWWVWRPILSDSKKIGYTKLRLATTQEIESEMPKSVALEDDECE